VEAESNSKTLVTVCQLILCHIQLEFSCQNTAVITWSTANTAKYHSSDSHGVGWVPNYPIFLIIRRYLYWPKFLQVIFLLQLIRAVFHLDISFICLFGVIMVLYYVVCSLHSHWNCGARVKGSGDTAKADVQTLLGVLFEQACFIEEALFSDKKPNTWSWDHSPQVPDYRDFWIVRH
jgi:hypothetical protein